MRYLLPLVLLTACSAASDPEPTDSVQQAATSHWASNGTAGLQLPQGSQLCHYTYFEGDGAASVDTWSGGSLSFGSATLAVFPNSGATPPRPGFLGAQVRCVPLTAFGPLVPSQTFTTVPQNGQSVQSGAVTMAAMVPSFDRASACTLSTLIGHTDWWDYSYITNNGSNYIVNNYGPAWLGTAAECVTLGRAGGPVMTLEARPGSSATGIPVSQGECMLQEIHGSINDGGFELTQSGNWALHVWGSTLYARALCWNY